MTWLVLGFHTLMGHLYIRDYICFSPVTLSYVNLINRPQNGRRKFFPSSTVENSRKQPKYLSIFPTHARKHHIVMKSNKLQLHITACMKLTCMMLAMTFDLRYVEGKQTQRNTHHVIPFMKPQKQDSNINLRNYENRYLCISGGDERGKKL